MNTLDESAIACHEQFMSFVRAGFTEPQALQLVAGLLAAMIAMGQIKGET